MFALWTIPRLRPATVDPTASTLPVSAAPALPITSYPGHELRPRLSPAGDRLVFAWRGRDGANWDIYLQHVRNGEPHRLTDHPGADVSPAWSPDGSRIAYYRFGEDDCGIYVRGVPGGTEQMVKACFRFPAADIAMVAPKLEWSPDGDALAFTAASKDVAMPLRIVRFSLSDGASAFLSDPPADFVGDFDPAFSPDGRWLAVCRVRTWADRDLVVIDRESGAERQVTFDSRVVLGHDWTPDGERLVFSSNRDGSYRLWSVSRDGGPARWLPAEGGYLKYPSLARGSAAIAYESWQYDTNLWSYPVEGDADQPPTKCVASTRWDFQPDYDDVHRRVTFVSNRSGSFEVWRCGLDGADPLRLTDLGAAMVGAPRWSPAGDALVFHAWRQGKADLFIWREGAGPVKPVLASDADELFADWSPDGRWLYCTSNAEDGWQLWRIASAGGAPERLTTDGGWFAQPTRDGQHLVFTRARGAVVYRMPVNGGEAERLFALDSVGDWGHLAAVEGGVLFIKRDDNFAAQLAFFDFSTGAVTVRRPLCQNLPLHEPGLTAPRDGTWVLLSQIDETEADILFSGSARTESAFYPGN